MRFHADLHVHSKYSRACSRDGDLAHLAWWAARKGISVVGTGDFTHPAWSEELRAELVPAEPGLYRLRPDLEDEVRRSLPATCQEPVRFLLSTEISTIYKRDDRTRKVHHLLYAPDLGAVQRITAALARVGNLASDGRPILGLDSRHLLEITLEAGDGCYLVPAHVWTPWFAVLGSQSGFDAVEECYGDLAGHVFALETGLSSDPAMNFRVSSLDRYRLVSNSDAHSPPMLGREATTFETPLDYFSLLSALRTGEGFAGTIELFPEEGKYHLDGHRACQVRTEPAETRAWSGRCRVCQKPLTVGVLHRLEDLADQPPGRIAPGAAGYQSLIPLPEIVAELLRVSTASKSVARQVAALVARLGPELAILESVALDEVATAAPSLMVEALRRLRGGRVIRQAGYDGVYGTIRLFRPEEMEGSRGNQSLFRIPATASARAHAPAPPLSELATSAVHRAGSTAAVVPARTDLARCPQGAREEQGAPVLDGLDPAQRAVVDGWPGPLLVVAGPGTGKTRLLVHLLAHHLVDLGVAPERCLAVTFTRRACGELRERLSGLVPGAARAHVTTFGGLGLLIVREQARRLGLDPEVRVIDEGRRVQLVRELTGVSDQLARRMAERVSATKRRRALLSLEGQGDETGEASDLDVLLPAYDAAMRSRGLVDLEDLSVLPVQLLAADSALADQYRDRFEFLCIDEYQDIDGLQYGLVRLIAPRHGSVCAIGDPDQAIYGFRGGDVSYFLRFRTDFPGARVAELGRNYRCTPTILAAALQAVRPATLAPGRSLQAVRADADGPVVVYRAQDESDEAAFVAETVERLVGGSSFLALDQGSADRSSEPRLSFADIAVLYRTARQAEAVAEALARRGFPCQVRSHDRLADRPGVMALLDILSQQASEERSRTVAQRLEEALRLASELAASAGAAAAGAAELATAAELMASLAGGCGPDLDRFLTEVALGAELDTWDRRADRVSLLTLHASKGLEFPVVFIVGCDDGLLPYRPKARGGEPDTNEAEERRLLYVGMTRATSHLVLTCAATRTLRGRRQPCRPSPFLADIEPSLIDDQTPKPGSRRTMTRQLRLL